MAPLHDDLQTPKQNLDEFAEITKRVLAYLPNIISEKVVTRDYSILSSAVAGTTKYARPINNLLFIEQIDDFYSSYNKLRSILKKNNQRKDCHPYLLSEVEG